MTLPEELRQASITALDHGDLLERAAAKLEQQDNDLQWIARRIPIMQSPSTLFSMTSIGVLREIVHDCISCARAALSTQGEKK